MKKIYTIIGLFLILTNSFGNEVDKLKTFCNSFSSEKLESGLNNLNIEANPGELYSWKYELNREIIAGHREQIIEVKKRIGNDDSYKVKVYQIKLIKNKDGFISYYALMNNFYAPNPDLVLACDSTKKLNQLKGDYERVFGGELQINNLFNTEIVFGEACGIVGIPPEKRQQLNDLVAKKNTKTLMNWLRSPNTETQLYAIDGILELAAGGTVFLSYVYDIIELIKNKDGLAITCAGCIYSSRPIRDVVLDLEEKYK